MPVFFFIYDHRYRVFSLLQPSKMVFSSILGGKTIKNVQINPQTADILWSKLNVQWLVNNNCISLSFLLVFLSVLNLWIHHEIYFLLNPWSTSCSKCIITQPFVQQTTILLYNLCLEVLTAQVISLICLGLGHLP